MTPGNVKIRIVRAIAAVLSFSAFCTAQTYWTRAYPASPNEEVYAIKSTADGDVIVLGSTGGFANPGLHLTRLNPATGIVWQRTFPGNGAAYGYALERLSEGSFIAAGMTYSSATGRHDAFFIAIKDNGDTLWTRILGGAYDYFPYAITAAGGNFIAAGLAIDNSGGGQKVYVLKINASGDTLWSKRVLESGMMQIKAVAQSANGNYVVGGSMVLYGRGAYILAVNATGDSLWTKYYAAGEMAQAGALIANPDSTILAAGMVFPPAGQNLVFCLSKIAADGKTLWTKSYETIRLDQACSIVSTLDGNFIVTGQASSATGRYDPKIIKVKPDGDVLWAETRVASINNYAEPITRMPDGTYVVAWVNYYAQNSDALVLFSIVDDQYANKNDRFTFKIPVLGDSLNHGYNPLNVPAGMTVSTGGTVSWTPATDSVYREHVAIQVYNDFGLKDTLTFNIFVNTKSRPVGARLRTQRAIRQSPNDIVVKAMPSKVVYFSLPEGVSSLCIFTIHGKLVEKLSVADGHALWRCNSGGWYLAKVICRNREVAKGFLMVR